MSPKGFAEFFYCALFASFLTTINDAGAQPTTASLLNSESVSFFRAGDRMLSIQTIDQECWLETRSNKRLSAPKLKLELRPPCYLLTWQHAPVSKKSSISGGHAVGTAGDVMTWRYPNNKKLDSIAMVIGDPIPAAEVASKLGQLRANFRCGTSLQGVAFDRKASAPARLTSVDKNSGITCVEQGLDEKAFWLMAHPK